MKTYPPDLGVIKEVGTEQTIKMQNMKKLILAAILTFAIASGLSAQTKNPNTNPGTNKNSPGYIDNNKNGICDNYENNSGQYTGRRQGKGNGSCMRSGQGRMNMQGRRGGNARRRG
jgi:hypothetical protein